MAKRNGPCLKKSAVSNYLEGGVGGLGVAAKMNGFFELFVLKGASNRSIGRFEKVAQRYEFEKLKI
jgi:hypothetical protein